MDEGFPDYYSIEGEIGRGAFCTIHECIDRRNDECLSVKIVKLPKMTATTGLEIKDIQREISICHKLKHPHIVQILGAHKVGDCVYMVTEYMDGVDLCEEIINRVNNGFVYSEAVASHYMRQVFEALAYIHERNIIHRDLKPHNIVLASKDDTAPVKINDFSVAIQLQSQPFIKSGRIGTPHFMAPEVVKREPYDCAVDIWGCGVILFILLCGSFPFHGSGERLFESIEKGKFTMKTRQWQSISERARDLVLCMLTVDANERITADGVLSHPWLVATSLQHDKHFLLWGTKRKDREHSGERTHLKDSIDELIKFNARKKLKGEVMASLARRRAESEDEVAAFENEDGCDKDNASLDEHINLSDSGVVAQLIDSLDDIQLMAGGRKEDISFLQWLFEIPLLHTLLEIHTKVSKVTQQKLVFSAKPVASEASSQVLSSIEILESNDDRLMELIDLLKDPHIMALLKSHDAAIHEIQSGGNLPLLAGNTADMTDSIAENLTRVRLVQFTKSGAEPLGVTLKINEENKCLVARIIHGGMIHRQGTLHVGDEIKEINGLSVSRQSVENLQAILREATGDVTFKIVPNLRNNEMEEKKKFVRTLFDYDPRADDFIPCQQAGIAFKRGEILQIVSQNDAHWWQAIRAGDSQKAGLVPSPELQEFSNDLWQAVLNYSNRRKHLDCPIELIPFIKKIASHAVGKSKKDGSVKCFWKGLRKKKKIGKYIARHNSCFDQLDLLTYEEVSYVSSFKRKTVVLIGAHGVGRRHIKNSLISRFPEKYAYPIPHTSRAPRINEEHGVQYYFVSEESMQKDAASHRFLEYGTHENAIYGTKLDTIRDVINSGSIAVLDVEPPALKILRCAEFAPFVVFIAAPMNLPQRGDKEFDESLDRLVSDTEALKDQLGHYFDMTIRNHNINDTIEELITALDELDNHQWVPTSWLY